MVGKIAAGVNLKIYNLVDFRFISVIVIIRVLLDCPR
jgi:hypothetical protein